MLLNKFDSSPTLANSCKLSLIFVNFCVVLATLMSRSLSPTLGYSLSLVYSQEPPYSRRLWSTLEEIWLLDVINSRRLSLILHQLSYKLIDRLNLIFLDSLRFSTLFSSNQIHFIVCHLTSTLVYCPLLPTSVVISRRLP